MCSMVNNAGIAPPPSIIHETTEESWDSVMAVNARSVFLGSKYAISQMLKQNLHASGERGWIINIASITGLVGCAATRKPESRRNRSEDKRLTKLYSTLLRFKGCHCINDETSSYRLCQTQNPLQRNLPRM